MKYFTQNLALKQHYKFTSLLNIHSIHDIHGIMSNEHPHLRPSILIGWIDEHTWGKTLRFRGEN